MNGSSRQWRVARVLGLAMLVFAIATSAFAQAQTGNIFGRVIDADGAALPGVTVTLSGIGATQVFVTDSEGRFRFLSLSPGRYTVAAELAGFGSVVRTGVDVNVGRNTNLDMTLTPAIEQTITVTAETPLLDVRKTGTGATVTSIELEEVPSARDPWVILQQVPGVLMDRINVGGNESGQQSQFVSKGADGFQATFNVDGVNQTDMIATGGSSNYYDFGSFEEIQVTTGGTDPRIMTPGAQINIVTKRGTNQLDGSARYYLTDGDWQSDPSIPAEAASYLGRPNEIREITEWGVELGGPIVRDRLWLWGAYAEQDIGFFVAQPLGRTDRYTDDTILETTNLKVNAQILSNNSAVGTWTDAAKIKIGRDISPTRPPETAFNQGAYGPTGDWKIEDTHIFNPNFYLTGLYSKVNLGFFLHGDAGRGCMTQECTLASPQAAVLDLATGEWRNTFVSFQGLRPQETVRLDGSTFFDTGMAGHELRFGFGYRTAGNTSDYFWPHNQLILDFSGFDPTGGLDGFGLTGFRTFGSPDYEYQYTDLYVGDTIMWGDLTLQVGARFDKQEIEFGPVSVPEHPLMPHLMPALTIPADVPDALSYDGISPRIGATYALGAEKKTLLRAAYNQYVAQMGSNSSGANGTQPYYRLAYFYTLDANGNDLIEDGEILFEYGGDFYYFDPDNPTAIQSTLRVGSGVNAPKTREFILGFEHELLPEFTVGATYTRRKFDDFLWRQAEKTRGSGDFYSPADYVQAGSVTGTLPDGSTYSVPYFELREGVPVPTYFVLTNRPGYEQTYDGVELFVVKRMSNRWMMRANASWMDWKQSVDEAGYPAGDPTRLRSTASGATGCTVCDGTIVQASGTISGAKGGIFINSEWSYAITGVYQIPVIETNLGVNISGRQGFPNLYGHTVRGLRDGTKTILVTDIGDHRLPDIFQLDLRLSKDFGLGPVGLQVALDAFNVTNEQTIMQRSPDLVDRGAPLVGANRIREMQSPRILRAGIRLTF
jgi:hypothetical protein